MLKIDRALVRGSFILMIVFNIYSFLNFIFQASMARLLTVSDYGIMAALFYLVYILSIFAESLQTVFAKTSVIEKDDGKLKNLMKRSLKKIFFFGLAFFAVYLIVMIPFSIYKEIPYLLFFINGLFIFTSLSLPVFRGILQGRKNFYSLGLNLIAESVIKLVLATLFVLIGWRIYGAIFGSVLGTFSALLLSFPQLKKIFKVKETETKTLEVKTSSRSVFLITFSLLAFYIVDIFIVQFVFSKEIAGYYAIAAILSKAIFWGTQPIGRAMFPISAENALKDKKGTNHNTYLNSLGMLTILIVAGLTIFYYFPDLIIRIFAGKYIPQSAEILFYLGLATGILSYANLNILYKISRHANGKAWPFFVVFAIGLLLLFYFDASLAQFSKAFVAASLLFLVASIAFLRK